MTTCASCPSMLGAKNRSGLCRSCLAIRHNADPDVQARRAAGIARHLAKPGVLEAYAARIRAYSATLSDAERERRRVAGKANSARLRAANGAMTPATRAENGRKRSETVMAWCPPDWRPKYHSFIRTRRFKAAEARRVILAMASGHPEPPKYARQKARLAWCPAGRLEEYRKLQKAFGAVEARRIIEADLTPFERQLARVAAGAALVPAFNPRRADHDITLGGVATGML